MIRMLLLTLWGFGMFAGSVASGYYYLQTTAQGKGISWVFALGAVVMLGLSGIAFLLAARSHNPYAPKNEPTKDVQNDPQIATIGLESAVEKNNEIVSQWRKTNHMKDKMTMIKISSNTQKQPTAP